MSEKIEKLASQVLYFKNLYYTSGESGIDDAAYDKLEEELRRLKPNHPVLSMVGTSNFSLGVGEKVTHEPPMLSLDKTYVPTDILAFLKQWKDLCLSLKIDGLSHSVEYASDLVLLRTSSRGDGLVGENITSRLMHVASLPKTLDKNTLPKGAERGDYTIEVRGELYLPLSAFDRIRTEQQEEMKSDPSIKIYSSSRNAVQGIITKSVKDLRSSIAKLQSLRFLAYDLLVRRADNGQLLSPEELADQWGLSSKTQVLERLAAMGFDTPEYQRLRWAGELHGEAAKEQEKATLALLDSFLDKGGRDLAFDGEVFSVNSLADYRQLGATSHHPRGSLAFKRAGEVAVTRLLGIELSVGRTGKLSFTAKLQPVQLSGATIRSATLHNIAFIEEMGLAPGALVRIVRSGEVIPKVLEKVAADDPAAALLSPAPQDLASSFFAPEECLCGAPLERRGPELYCLNQEGCSVRGQNQLVYFLATLDVKNLSDKTIEKLIASGLVKSAGDFFRLRKEQLLQLEGFKDKKADGLLAALEERRSVDVGVFFASLGMPGVGRDKSKELASLFKSFKKIMALTETDLTGLKGWGEKTIRAFLQGREERKELIADLLSVMQVVDRQEQPKDSGGADSQAALSSAPLSGKVVVITGSLAKPRKDIEALIEAAGGKNSGAVSAKTSFLVCNEPSSSSKSKKAQELGVSVISEEQLLQLIAAS